VLDVVRAAAAEIADFPRVSFYGFEGDVAVVGNAVADVTHLLAELLENAAAFSPPETPVIVAGQAVDRRFVITITDEGIGMDDERLHRANTLLARPPAPGLALARTLGLYVVGHLAARHGIHVQVRRATGTGLTAVVAVPATILALAGTDAQTPEPATPREAPVRAEPVVDTRGPSTEAVVAERQSQPPPWPPPRPAAPPQPPVSEPASASPSTAQAPIAWRPGEPTPTAPSAPPPSAAPRYADPAPVAPAPAREPEPEPDDERLTRRVPADAPTNGDDEYGSGLTSRVPGTHLTHEPAQATTTSGDVRPRPERVHDMLSRHERGKRDGRVRAPDTAASADTGEHRSNGNGKDSR
jgi:anti-sigma regulatory factor (Ser/Thr protein kinase)